MVLKLPSTVERPIFRYLALAVTVSDIGSVLGERTPVRNARCFLLYLTFLVVIMAPSTNEEAARGSRPLTLSFLNCDHAVVLTGSRGRPLLVVHPFPAPWR